MIKASRLFRFSTINKQVPIIDLQPYLQGTANNQNAELLRKACKEIGFFYIANHGVSKQLQSNVFRTVKDFFALPLHEKQLIDITKYGINWKGYIQEGFEYTSTTPDQREGVWYGRELSEEHPDVRAGLPLHGRNPFPNSLPQFKGAILEWLEEMDRVGRFLSMAIADSLGLDRRYFADGACRDHLGTLGIIHYPRKAKTSQQSWGVSEHTDYGFLTMLMFDEPGLEAQDVNGKWIEIQPVSDAFVVNIGDYLEIMTKGLYKSTLHRVRTSTKKNRISLPYFYDVNWHTKVQALDIRISEDEQRIMERVKACRRWDDAPLHETDGIFGHYYIKKLMKTFPTNLQK